MDMQFYVYGVPKGFDLYGGKPDDIAYFQSYYDGSKENSKFTLHRRNNGLVVYSYLRYNLVDCDGRTGAFFGISIEFNGIYCTDITSFYELFEEVYKTIIEQGTLLKVMNNQTLFEVRALKDAEREINRVISILRKNLESAFANDFREMDSSFKQNVNKDKVCKLNIQKGNEAILQVSKEYPMLSISLEYIVPDDVERRITPEQLKSLYLIVQNIKQETDPLINEWQNINTLLNVRNTLIDRKQQQKIEESIVLKYSELRRRITVLNTKYNYEQTAVLQFLQNQKEHHYLLEFFQEFDNGKNTLKKLHESVTLIFPVIKQFGEDVQLLSANIDENNDKMIGEGAIKKDDKKSDSSLQIFLKKRRSKIFAATFVFATMVVVYFLFNMESFQISRDESDCPECVEYLNQGDDFLQKNRFSEAITAYKKAEEKGTDISGKIDEANTKAVDFYEEKAKEDFNNASRKKIESYNAAIKQLNMAKQYGSNIDKFADSFEKSTINYYFDEIKKDGQTQDKKIEYAYYILQIEPNNAKAQEVVNPPTPIVIPKNCKIAYNEKLWEVEDLLTQLEKDLNNNTDNSTFVISGCNAILNSKCKIKEKEKNRAEDLINKAKEKKGSMIKIAK